MITSFELTAKYCETVYGVPRIYEEETGDLEGFICPECEEPLYTSDWSELETDHWSVCPICGFDFFSGEVDIEDEDEEDEDEDDDYDGID